MVIPRWSKGEWAGERGRDWLAHQLLGCRDSNEGSRRQEQASWRGAESGAGRALEKIRHASCQAICTSFRYRWAKGCKFFWEDLSRRGRIQERHGGRNEKMGVCAHLYQHLFCLQNYCRCQSMCADVFQSNLCHFLKGNQARHPL